jgi:hypothetical protein
MAAQALILQARVVVSIKKVDILVVQMEEAI